MSVENASFPRTEVVISHYSFSLSSNKERDLTLRCLNSVRQTDYPNFGIIVVDSGSPEPFRPQRSLEGVDYMYSSDNLGCAESFNIGARHAASAGADYVFLLNNDTVISPDTLGSLTLFANQRSDIGVVGPKVLSIQNGQKTDLIQTIGGRFIGGNFAHWKVDRGQYENPREVDFVAGAALLVRGIIVNTIGLYDPRYSIWYEELDFGIRVREAGYAAYYYPSNVWHEGSQSLADRYSAKLGFYSTRNLLYTMRKHELAWKLRLLPRSLSVISKTLIGAIFFKHDMQTLQAVTRGFYHGVTDSL